jgi:hypothetical protein
MHPSRSCLQWPLTGTAESGEKNRGVQAGRWRKNMPREKRRGARVIRSESSKTSNNSHHRCQHVGVLACAHASDRPHSLKHDNALQRAPSLQKLPESSKTSNNSDPCIPSSAGRPQLPPGPGQPQLPPRPPLPGRRLGARENIPAGAMISAPVHFRRPAPCLCATCSRYCSAFSVVSLRTQTRSICQHHFRVSTYEIRPGRNVCASAATPELTVLWWTTHSTTHSTSSIFSCPLPASGMQRDIGCLK